MSNTTLTAASKNRFIDLYSKIGVITYTCQAVGIDRKTHYDWLAKDPDYAERFEEAKERAIDSLEIEARRRAFPHDKEVLYKGDVKTVKDASDTLLIFLLKGARPEKYKDRFEHTGPSGGPIQHSVDVSALPIELVKQIYEQVNGKGFGWDAIDVEGGVVSNGAKRLGDGTNTTTNDTNSNANTNSNDATNDDTNDDITLNVSPMPIEGDDSGESD